MYIDTAVLGSVDVDPGNIYHLPDGLYGFEGESDYALVTKQEDDVTLMWLQAVDAKVPCFVVFNPFEIIDGYEPVVERGDLHLLGCKDSSELTFLVIAVVPDDITKITVNLKSPVAINTRSNRARQVILANRDYPIRFPLFPQEGQDEGEGK